MRYFKEEKKYVDKSVRGDSKEKDRMISQPSQLRPLDLLNLKIGKQKMKRILLYLVVLFSLLEAAFLNGCSRAALEVEVKESPLICAYVVAKSVDKESDRKEALAKVAIAYARVGKNEKALNIAKGIRKYYYEAEVLAEIFSYHAKNGQTEEASKMLSQALRVAKKVKLSLLRSESFKKIALKCIEVGKYDEVIEIAHLIEQTFVKADVLVELASIYGNEGRKSESIQLLSQATLAINESHPSFRNKLWEAISIRLAEIGEFDQALKLARALGFSQHGAGAVGGISAHYMKSGQSIKGTQMLDQAIQIAQGINDPMKKTEALITIAREYSKVGEEDKVSDILFQSYNAAETINSPPLIFPALKAGVLVKISGEYLNLGLRDEAVELIEKAYEVASGKTHGRPIPKQLAPIAVKYAEMGEYEKAFQIVESIRGPSSKAAALAEIGVRYVKAGDLVGDAEKTILQRIVENP